MSSFNDGENMKSKIKKTSYDFLYYSFIAGLPLRDEYRKDFTRIWKALDKIIERDYVKKPKTLMFHSYKIIKQNK
jgi:hypothetical protein